MGQEGKSVGGMSSSCLGELSLHLFKGEEGNKNCILGQPQSWRTELGSNPVSFLPDRCNWGNMSFQDFLHWLEEGHETLLLSQGPLSFLGLCLSQHLLLVLQSSQILLPNSLQLRQPGDSLLFQQTGRRLRITVEQHCLGVQGLPLGSSFAPTPWNQAEGRCLEGLLYFLNSLPSTHHFTPTHCQGRKIPLWSWMMGPLQQWRQCPLVAAGYMPHERCPVHPRPERKGQEQANICPFNSPPNPVSQLVESWH